jgi:plasmid maintenance system antidote protein VapI
MNDIHIGQLIKAKLTESNISITEFARRIHCERSNVYSIFKRKSIDIELLILISKSLNFDFIHEYYQKYTAQDVSMTLTILLEGDKLKVVQHY